MRKLGNNVQLFARFLAKTSLLNLTNNQNEIYSIISTYSKGELVQFYNELACCLVDKVSSSSNYFVTTKKESLVLSINSNIEQFDLCNYIRTRMIVIISTFLLHKIQKHICPELYLLYTKSVPLQHDYLGKWKFTPLKFDNYLTDNPNFFSLSSICKMSEIVISQILGWSPSITSSLYTMAKYIKFIEKSNGHTPVRFLLLHDGTIFNIKSKAFMDRNNTIYQLWNKNSKMLTVSNWLSSGGGCPSLLLETIDCQFATKSNYVNNGEIWSSTLKINYTQSQGLHYTIHNSDNGITTFLTNTKIPKNIEYYHKFYCAYEDKTSNYVVFNNNVRNSKSTTNNPIFNLKNSSYIEHCTNEHILSTKHNDGDFLRYCKQIFIAGFYMWLILNHVPIQLGNDVTTRKNYQISDSSKEPRFVSLVSSFVEIRHINNCYYLGSIIYNYDTYTRNIWKILELYIIKFNSDAGHVVNAGGAINFHVGGHYHWVIEPVVNIENGIKLAVDETDWSKLMGCEDPIITEIFKEEFMEYYDIKNNGTYDDILSSCFEQFSVNWCKFPESDQKLGSIFCWDIITCPEELPFKCFRSFCVGKKKQMLSNYFKQCFPTRREFDRLLKENNYTDITNLIVVMLEARLKLILDFIDGNEKKITSDHTLLNEHGISKISEFIITNSEWNDLKQYIDKSNNQKCAFVIPIIMEILENNLLLPSSEIGSKKWYYNNRLFTT